MTAAALLRPPDWTRAAACNGHPLGPEAFDNATPDARAICAGCPVRYECALLALTEAIPDGMWGGLDPDDRAQIAAAAGYDRPGMPPHGSRSRYVHRDQPCRCQLCREAHRRWATTRREQGAWMTADTTTHRIAS